MSVIHDNSTSNNNRKEFNSHRLIKLNSYTSKDRRHGEWENERRNIN